MTRLHVCELTALPAGSSTTVEGDERIAVFHTEGGELHATSDTCTHEAWSLGEDSDLEGDEVVCPLHMARFDLRSGNPLCLPATIALKTYDVEVVDGAVFVLV